MKSILAIIVLNLVILVNDITIQKIEPTNIVVDWKSYTEMQIRWTFHIYLPNLMYNGVARTRSIEIQTNKQNNAF